jgi:GT2 family glycosyltransferase
MLNAGAAAAKGSYTHYLFLGHEVEAIDPGWLEHLLSYGQRPDVAVAGALLLGRGQVVRHAGFVVEPSGLARHALRGHPFRHWIAGRNPGPNGALLAGRDVTAVSAACLLTPVELFDRLGGFDERLTVALYDVDYCLRAAALGYKVIHDPYAVLLDRSDETRRAAADLNEDSDVRFFQERHRKFLETGDPFSCSTIRPARRSSGRQDAAVADLVKARTMPVVLPAPSAAEKTARTQVHGAMAPARGPHRRFSSVDIETQTRS